MAVVINEFEIVAEQPAPAAQAPDEQPKPPPLATLEVLRVLRYEAERALRVWAH